MHNDFFKQFNFEHLNHLQIGKVGEYWVKLFLTLAGFDIYTTEVDDKGIDFVIRTSVDKHLDVQVKAIRLATTSYVFVEKERWEFKLRENLFMALVLIENNAPPATYLIPSTAWLVPNLVFKDRDFGEGKKSKPEWGINLSKRNLPLLEQFQILTQIQTIL
jgi:hypothetical protein